MQGNMSHFNDNISKGTILFSNDHKRVLNELIPEMRHFDRIDVAPLI